MNDLVFLQHRQALTTSLKVAEYFEKRHRDVLRTIDGLNSQMSTAQFCALFNESSYVAENGKSNKMYFMNRDGFSLLVMGFTGKKALQFKLDFINAFNAMEQKLVELQSEQWKEIRAATKVGYRELSAAVKELYEWAVAHGCKAPEKVFYMNFAKLMDKTLGINPKSRDTLAIWQLYEIEKLQFIARTIIAGLLAKGEDYHLPYRDCKSAFESYARLSFINQRLLQ